MERKDGRGKELRSRRNLAFFQRKMATQLRDLKSGIEREDTDEEK